MPLEGNKTITYQNFKTTFLIAKFLPFFQVYHLKQWKQHY